MIKMIKYFLIFVYVFFLSYSSEAQSVEELKKEYLEAVDLKTRTDILGDLAVEYCNIDIDSAKLYVDSILKISSKPSVMIRWRANAVAGYVYERMGEYDIALKYQMRSLESALKTNDTKIIANSFNGVGVIYDYLGNYDKALEYYFKAYRISKKSNDKMAMQQSLGNIGLAYHLKGDFNNAMKYLFESLKIAEENPNDSGYSSVLNNIALVFQQQKNYKKALEYYQKCLQIFLKNNQKYDIALSYNNIGSVYLDQKLYKKAIEVHLKSLAIKSEINDAPGKVVSYQNLGMIYTKLNKLDTALLYLKLGEIIVKDLPDKASEIELYNSLGIVYYELKDFEIALNYLEKSIEIYNSGTEYYKIFETYNTISKVYYEMGKFKEAADYKESYWTLMDSIQNNENAKNLQQKELENKYLFKKRADELKKKIEDEASEKQKKLWIIIIGTIIIGLLLVILLMYRGFYQKKKANNLLSERNALISEQNDEIKKQSVLLEEKNRDITDSIQYAKRLQDAILPDPGERDRVIKDHFILYRPKDIVSGDFYWLHDLSDSTQAKYLFAVVDCTGHGVPGGFVSIVGNNALNRAVNEFGLSKPSEILDKISILVEESFHSDNEEIRDGMDLALISISNKNNKLMMEYAGANNPVWIFKQNDNSDECEMIELKGDKQPIGKYEYKIPFTNHKLELNKGDFVYLFSDGYADQFGGPSGKKFKYSQLKEKLFSMRNKKMKDQELELNQLILLWRGEMEQIDDICIAGIKI